MTTFAFELSRRAAGLPVTGPVAEGLEPEAPDDLQVAATSAYPSGHEAATGCLCAAIAILVIGHARGRWRWLSLIPAVAMPALVALSRMYRGEHHPTDILGSLLFSALWLTAVTMLIRPTRQHRRAGPSAVRRAGPPAARRAGPPAARRARAEGKPTAIAPPRRRTVQQR